MIERELDIATQDGAMNTYTVRPDDSGPFPVVLMLMDAPGVREGLREICRRISQSGYYVLLPQPLLSQHARVRARADAQPVLDKLPSLVDAKPGKVGLALYRRHIG